MKHFYLALLLILFALPVSAQNVPGSATQTINQDPAPRSRLMPFLPYTGALDTERTKKQRKEVIVTQPVRVVEPRSYTVETRSYTAPTVQQDRSSLIVFNEGATDLTPLAVERIKQSAQRIKLSGHDAFSLTTYYQEGDTASKVLATQRLKIVNNALSDLGIKKTIQTYAQPRKQIIVNKDTVIITVK